jgi:hypothetical protein
VYIREAHPQDGWQVGMNVDQAIVYDQPTTSDERASVAEACMLHLEFEMPMLLDDMSNDVDEKYVALPERLYVVDEEGRVAWRCGMGPFGFDIEGFERAICERISPA